MSQHAILSASGAAKWLACPGSIALEAQFPDTQSPEAAEGTIAHELAEKALRERYHGVVSEMPAGRYTAEMFEMVSLYRDNIERLIQELGRGERPVVMVEQRLSFARWVPEGFGTGDCVLLFPGARVAAMVDLKYGKGVKVYAERNPQLMLYGAGTMDLVEPICDIDRIVLVIDQPRLSHLDVWEVSKADLLDWLDSIRPVAEAAHRGTDELHAGDHCREKFCKAQGACPELERTAMAVFEDGPVASTLSPERISELLPKVPLVAAWAKSVEAYALDRATNHGVRFPGYKLVEGRTTRRWSDEDAVAAVLKEEGVEDDAIWTKKLLGLGDAEKLLGKKHRVFELTVRQAARPTLVPESDKRPEFNSAAAVSAAFED